MPKKKATPPPPVEDTYRTIEIENTGPIPYLKVRLPKEGGLVVCRGKNGVGKSHALAAINSLVTGHGKPPVMDGTESAEIDGLGVTMRIAGRVSRSGEVEVTSLEGRFSVFDLVDPGISKPESADAKRIKALIQLSGASADASLFHKLLGGKKNFNEIVSAGAVDPHQELTEMAARIKRDIEARARVEEDAGEKARIEQKTHKEAASDIDTSAPHDQATLSAALESAVREEEKLKTQQENAASAELRAISARRSLNEAKENYKGPSVEDAARAVGETDGEIYSQAAVVDRIKADLQKAEAELQRLRDLRVSRVQAQQTAQAHAEAMQTWRKTIEEATAVEDVPDGSLEKATKAVQDARTASEQGFLIRRAIDDLQKAENARRRAKAHEQEAQYLRDAAAGIDGVLSSVVGRLKCPLRVADGRLVLTTERGEELYADLSDGEQWKVALDIAIDAVGEGGLIVIDQKGFQGLDPDNRSLIHDHLTGTGVIAITAEATGDDGLRADIYDPNEEEEQRVRKLHSEV